MGLKPRASAILSGSYRVCRRDVRSDQFRHSPDSPAVGTPISPTADFVIHVLIVAAEVAALVVVDRLARQQRAASAPQLEDA